MIGIPGGRRDQQAMTGVRLFSCSPVQVSVPTKQLKSVEFIVGSRVEGVGFGSCGLGVIIVHVIVIVANVRVIGSKLHGIFFTGWLVIRSGNGFCQSTSRPVCAGKLYFFCELQWLPAIPRSFVPTGKPKDNGRPETLQSTKQLANYTVSMSRCPNHHGPQV